MSVRRRAAERGEAGHRRGAEAGAAHGPREQLLRQRRPSDAFGAKKQKPKWARSHEFGGLRVPLVYI